MKFLKTLITNYYLLITLVFFGAFFRFYNLNWDRGYFFNPDESNNIAHPAAILKFPFKPESFTYGSFTLYLYRFGAATLSSLTKNQAWLDPDGINIVGRAISSSLSTILIFLTYYLGKNFYSKTVGLLACLFTSLNVGLIQAAHFGTTETILTAAGILTIIAIWRILKEKNCQRGYFLAAFILALSSGAKISASVFFPPFFLSHLASLNRKNFIKRNLLFLLSLGVMFLVFFLVSPYSLLDFSLFRGSFLFERDIATGKLPMFFTAQFQETTPYLFQIQKIFPWILGWPILIFGALGFLTILFQSLLLRNKEKFFLFFLPFFYFLYNGSLFVKWTRYFVPLVPFFCLFAAFVLVRIYQKSKNFYLTKFLVLVLIGIVIILQAFYAASFFDIYRKLDTRIVASEWIYQNLPPKSSFLLEPLDVVVLPLPLKDREPSEYHLDWFDFYGFDEVKNKTALIEELAIKLSNSDYIIIGSRRVYANRLRLKNKYPLTANYYNLLFGDSLGFEKIREFSSYPNLFGIEINDDSSEETFQVFDHPKVLIFANKKHLPVESLKILLSL